MQIGTLFDLQLAEVPGAISVICEDEAGPRLKFQYPNFKVDPDPDILMLGDYYHPSTHNHLVGGVNLHYLSDSQIDQLRTVLPKIMQGKNLKARYDLGKKLLPSVFNAYYRTYDAKFIRSPEKDAIYPKYGFTRRAFNWVKKQAEKLYKSKEQRQKDAEPEFPSDLRDFPNRLDMALQQAQDAAQVPPPTNPDRDDQDQMDLARQSFNKLQRDRMRQNVDDQQRRRGAPQRGQIQQEPVQQPLDPRMGDEVEPQPVPQRLDYRSEPIPVNQTPVDQAQRFTQYRPAQPPPPPLPKPEELHSFESPDELEESITYYSPRVGKYITESIRPFSNQR